ncbi:hypothetical protein QUB80_07705 [Chlorogloeopsis sp. ULAP01]|uniref:hypothetical protein n=1 Tax=Chlorogloeopsis sp. ULAP01 TaxID=3056483 RepID=UPI0025AA35AC|nr:hypothetical protein [Chlorogloeopsis sp. ULAP01]MDM9380589.1 hypothetical protein [Chlorogloeopsis sp. ULAP01]
MNYQNAKDVLNIKKLTTKSTLDAERLLTLREAGQSPSTEATTLREAGLRPSTCLPVRVEHKGRNWYSFSASL